MIETKQDNKLIVRAHARHILHLMIIIIVIITFIFLNYWDKILFERKIFQQKTLFYVLFTFLTKAMNNVTCVHIYY